MTIAEIDPVIHPPKRLAAMAILNSSSSTDFSSLRSHLGCGDSDLSKQMTALQALGRRRIGVLRRFSTFDVGATMC